MNKPFCVLLPVETLGRQYMRDHFVSLDYSLVDIVIPRRRIQYTSSKPGVKMNSPFHSVWFCYKMEKQENSYIHPLGTYYVDL